LAVGIDKKMKTIEPEKYRVLQVANMPVTFEKILLPLLEILKINNFEVDICCGDGEYLQTLMDRGFKVIEMPFSRKAFTLKHIRAFFSLYRFLKREDYRIVHLHTPIVSAIGRVAARLAGVPVIIHTAHGFYFHDHMNPLAYKLFFGMEKILARWATDFLFLVSKEDETLAKEKGFMADKERIIWIGNGVDPQRFMLSHVKDDLRNQMGFSKDDVIIGFIGRVV